jgi:hypothetical protein
MLIPDRSRNQQQPITELLTHCNLNEPRIVQNIIGETSFSSLSQEDRQRLVDSIIVAADLPPSQISVSNALTLRTIMFKLAEYEHKVVVDSLKLQLTKRFSILGLHKKTLRTQQVKETPNYEEQLSKNGTVTLAPRNTDFDFFGGRVNLDLTSEVPPRYRSSVVEGLFDESCSYWKRSKLIKSLNDEIFDVPNYSLVGLSQKVNRIFSPVSIVLTHETYGPDLKDYMLALLGFPRVLEPLDGISFCNDADTKIWNETHDSRLFLKRYNEEKKQIQVLNWNIGAIPELAHIYQKTYPVYFDYFDNHIGGF